MSINDLRTLHALVSQAVCENPSWNNITVEEFGFEVLDEIENQKGGGQ